MSEVKMRELIGKEFKLSDKSVITFIGGDYLGDYFLIFPNGKILLLLDFKIVQQGKKKWVEIKKFLLVDEGINK